MASPLGHFLVGQAAYRVGGGAGPERDARLAWFCALAAIAADLDFLPGLLVGTPALYHQGASHSLLAAGAITALLALLYRGAGGTSRAVWPALALAALSHLALDMLGPDRRPPYGLPLFWPFTDATFLSPIALFPGVRHAGRTGTATAEWLARTASVENLVNLLREVLILGPLLLWLEWKARRRAVPG
jgi:inner membrane protein